MKNQSEHIPRELERELEIGQRERDFFIEKF